MTKKVLFLHGFMGSPLDGQFLQKLDYSVQLTCLAVPHTPPFKLETLYDAIDRHNPDVIYGYSLGGRLALNYIHTRRPSLDLLVLESASFGIKDEDERKKRLELDQVRSNSIKKDLKEFLRQWYKMDLWGELTDKKRNQFIQQKYERWSLDTTSLSSALNYYSPGLLPYIAPEDLTCPLIYFYGQQDRHYSAIAKNMKHSYGLQGVGHCIHQSEQVEELISQLSSQLKTL